GWRYSMGQESRSRSASTRCRIRSRGRRSSRSRSRTCAAPTCTTGGVSWTTRRWAGRCRPTRATSTWDGVPSPGRGSRPTPAAGVNCAFTQVYAGLDLAGLRAGQTVVIQGAGGLGVYACAVAREMGAGSVIVIDGVDERLALARQFGADEIVDLREHRTPEARVKRVTALTDGWGGDVVMELVGNPSVVDEGLRMTAPEGT